MHLITGTLLKCCTPTESTVAVKGEGRNERSCKVCNFSGLSKGYMANILSKNVVIWLIYDVMVSLCFL